MYFRPNTITLIALIVNGIPAIYQMYQFGLDYESPIDAYMCYWIGISFTIYVILDNCDGK